MKELSLFTGAGGGVLGGKLLGWETIGYVEWNEYCQRVIRQRIDDEIFDNAPIFCDVRSFISEGYAASYQGMVDVISAGFPCQPYSVAGGQQGEDDPRDMWPSTRDCIRIIRPPYALLENVTGLLADAHIRRIYGDLAEMGYDAKWGVLGAGHLGGWHLRERWWLVASDPRQNGVQRDLPQQVSGEFHIPWEQDVRGVEDLRDRPSIPSPQLCGVRHGLADYVDRISSIGNGQVPVVAATAWQILR